SGLFDTHPPIEERIRRVHPGFQRTAYRGKRPPQEAGPAPSAEGFGQAAVSGFSSGATQQAGRRPADIGSDWGRSAGDSAKLVGTLTASKIDFAARLVASLPAALRESLRDP